MLSSTEMDNTWFYSSYQNKLGSLEYERFKIFSNAIVILASI